MMSSLVVPEWLVNFGSFFRTESSTITAVTAILGTVFALWNLRAISRDSRARARPYVTFEPVPGIQNFGSIDLLITNRGASPAKHLSFDVADRWVEKEDDHITKTFYGLLRREFFLAPGAQIRLMWRGTGEFEAGADDKHRITVTYQDTSVRKLWWKKKYKDEFIIDTSFAVGAPAPQKGTINSNSDKELRALENINHALRTINTHIGMMR
ncbi:hypothetical protein [Rothia sp. ZJ932]|uniref:hypothetical protein n=1 Tax=Rothia sp. ZJ932 TaxID=2810516 RepID=UPI001966EF72|nr:hypothetical protein [Rothia sp. ZJ932]QRZ61371.1 hypothetical protein JR346_09100 [Rothia sp. ZJ932]